MGARLFGRDRELGRAVATFERVAEQQDLGVLWIHGDAGVGKSALVDALHEACPEGRWAHAKFTEHAAPLPFGAALGMLSTLLRERLAEGDEEVDRFAQRMRAALGASAGVLTSVVPELAHLLGPQSAPSWLDAREGEGRFRAQLERALETLAEPGRPLVLVFDDLQWADPVHLRLLQGLTASAEALPMLIVGLWRDHVALPPAFVALRSSLSQRGIPTHEEALAPLSSEAIHALVVDRTGATSAELDAIVLPRAAGNPLLAEALLSELVRGSALVRSQGQIHVDPARLERLHVEAGIGALLAARIDALDLTSREVLAVLSWFPAATSLEELARASGRSTEDVQASLAAAAELGLVRAGARAGFLHDHIRDVARPSGAAVAPLARTVVERLAGPGAPPTEAGLFLAADLVPLAASTQGSAEHDLALLRDAGRRAHAAGDFTRAARHFRRARALAGSDDVELTFELVECLVADGLFAEAEDTLARLDVQDGAPTARARARLLSSRIHVGRNRPREAVDASKAALAVLGIP